MKKVIYLFAMIIIVIACSSKTEMPFKAESHKALTTSNRLKLSSKAELLNMIERAESGINTKGAGGGNILDPADPDEIDDDPIMRIDCKEALEAAIEDGLSNENIEELSIYEIAGYDSLVPNIAFASLLNKRGEIQVADTIYKISPKGTYYFHESKLQDFEQEYEELENIENEEESEYDTAEIEDESGNNDGGEEDDEEEDDDDDNSVATGKELRPGIYRYNTFNRRSKKTLTVSSSSNNSNKFGYDINNVYHLYNYNWDNAPRYSIKAKTLVGKLHNFLFGYNSRHDQYIGKYHRLKGGLYSYDYLVYHETGITSNFQKKKVFWSKSNADELFLGWKNIVLFTPYKSGLPTPEKNKLKTPGIIATNLDVTIPFLSKKEKTAYVSGLTLTREQIKTIVELYPHQIAGYLSNLCGNKVNLQGIYCFHLFSDGGVYSILPGNVKMSKKTGRLVHVFSKGWDLDTNLPNAVLTQDWKTVWNNFKQYINKKKSDLVVGEGAIACYFDGKYRGMIFYKD